MKYALLFVETEQVERDWEAMSEANRDRASGPVYKWTADHAREREVSRATRSQDC